MIARIADQCAQIPSCTLAWRLEGDLGVRTRHETSIVEALNRSAAGTGRLLEPLCAAEDPAVAAGDALPSPLLADDVAVWTQFATEWPCDRGHAEVAERVLGLAFVHAVGMLLVRVLRTIHAPYTSRVREMLRAELLVPRHPGARQAVIGAALRGDDRLIEDLPWETISVTDAYLGARQVGYLATEEISREAAHLARLAEPEAVAAAVVFATRLARDNPARIAVRARLMSLATVSGLLESARTADPVAPDTDRDDIEFVRAAIQAFASR